MGDIPTTSGVQSFESLRAGFSQDEGRGDTKASAPSTTYLNTSGFGTPSVNAPFYSQYTSLQAPQQHPRAQFQHDNTPYSSAPEATFNMGAIAGALPDYTVPQTNSQMHQGQRSQAGASPSGVGYQLQQLGQYQNLPSSGYQGQTSYQLNYTQNPYATYAPSQSAQQTSYPAFNPNSPRSLGLNAGFPNYPQAPSQYLHYPPPYGSQGSYPPSYTSQIPHQQQSLPYNRRSSLPAGQPSFMGQPVNQGTPSGSYGSVTRPEVGGWPGDHMGGASAPDTTASSIPRGPPRKPRQSGHALWVGNLPPGTTVMDLKDHFSKDATKFIESLFLISKSNCAFVNYRTEASCADAMHRFHDSRFHGVRLVCRLRRSSAATSGVPTGPSAMAPPRPRSISPAEENAPPTEAVPEAEDGNPEVTQQASSDSTSRVPEKFFIVKSLTLQDLEMSVRNGIWATQSHNEETLNKAYESADNVYLIFSANKSGEYFGYARMTSSIHEDANQIINTVARTETVETVDVPKSIPTPATEHAPKGRIIDDSARGTIFWEADLSDEEVEDPQTTEESTNAPGADNSATAQTWGKPFKVEWISTNRLPFYRTRGLRNPWNANREVKIARDGTELETSVGKRLVQMFHRLGQSSTAPLALPAMQTPLPPSMRPF